MYIRISILAVAALLLALEVIFLPCDYQNPGLRPDLDAGYHTVAGMSNEMILDLDALVCEISFTLLAAAAALVLAQFISKKLQAFREQENAVMDK